MASYPAITLWQPWASLVAAGAKPFEFRGWAAPAAHVGKRVAIHAGARLIRRDELQDLLVRLQTGKAAETGLVPALAVPVLEAALVAPGVLPRMAVVCLATLGRPVRGADLAARLDLDAVNDSDRMEHSNWGWPLTDVERLEPYEPQCGAQGWWRWRDTRQPATPQPHGEGA